MIFTLQNGNIVIIDTLLPADVTMLRNSFLIRIAICLLLWSLSVILSATANEGNEQQVRK